jgi:hypothetical protein
MATITIGSNTYNLITLPANVGLSDITFSMEDTVAVVDSPYVPSQIQTQTWPGADRWGFQAMLPKMTQWDAAQWIAFLAALRGRANVFQLGNPVRTKPAGAAKGTPLVDGTISGGNATSATTLDTKGWTPNIYRQLLAGDYMQIGYRFYMCVANVNSDANGKAQISIWPSLRETPADGAPIILANPVGVFRLANNLRNFHTTVDRLSQVSLQGTEVR